MLDGLASQAARYAGAEDHPNVRRRLAHEVTVQIQLRLARMIQACLKPAAGDAAVIIHGVADDESEHGDEEADAET